MTSRSANFCLNRNVVADTVSARVGTFAFLNAATQSSCNIPQTSAEARAQKAFCVRCSAAAAELDRPLPPHVSNGDEERYPSRIGNFSKGMPHDSYGEVDPEAYDSLLLAVQTGEPSDFDAIPQGCPSGRPFTNPQAGLAFDMEGGDTHSFSIPPAPTLASSDLADLAVELYWMALARDVPFSEYSTNPITLAAAAELTTFPNFHGPRLAGVVTPSTLFRGSWEGNLTGPYISQFMYLECPFGITSISQKFKAYTPSINFATTFPEWLDMENGCHPIAALTRLPTERYITTARDLCSFVHVDQLFQAHLQALMVLFDLGAPVSPTNPYLTTPNQMGFATFGGPHVIKLMSEASRAIQSVWYQKWFVHRMLRPEAYAGLVHLKKTGAKPGYPIDSDVLGSQAVASTFATYGSYLLPQAYPEGSPLHPSYASGHATVAGACVTILKAWFDESWAIPDPVQPNSSGETLVPYVGDPLTVGGELNKLACNIATGRNMAGIHWRCDGDQGNLLGEAVAISILRDFKNTYNENFVGFTFTKFDGTQITI